MVKVEVAKRSPNYRNSHFEASDRLNITLNPQEELGLQHILEK
ncbi:hypothetical protein [Nostoc sp. 106C]|nr:hypothetical protein [Nostoc sp. 106C]